MNNSYFSEKYRFILLPLAALVLIVLGLLIAVNGLAQKHDVLLLTCKADFYAKENNNTQVQLTITNRQKQAELRYEYLIDGQFAGAVVGRGRLVQFEVADMSYQFEITHGEIVKDIHTDMLPLHINELKTQSRKAINSSHSVPLKMKVLHMDAKAGYGIYRFFPGNQIWLCKMGI